MKTLFTILILAFLLSGCCLECHKIKNAKRSYDYAVKKCGIDNIREHNYTNGETDFDCKDYSKYLEE